MSSADALDLPAIRWRLTLAYAITAGLVILLLAAFAVGEGNQRIDDAVDADVRAQLADVTADGLRGEFEGFNTFYVIPEDDYVEPLGEFDIEPPLLTIGHEALDDGEAFVEFSQFDEPYLAYGRAISETEVVAAVSWVGFADDQRTSLLRGVAVRSILGLLLTSAAAWLVAGRSLAPAKEAMQRRTDFIADAAHQLRTPLAVIQASASHALAKEREGPAYRTSLAEIRDATTRASSAVNELLELARLEAGATELRRAPVRLDLLLEELAATIGASADVVVTDPPSIVVDADYTLLRQAIGNVISNAAERAGSVEISVHREGDTAVVHVADDGPGIPPEILPHIFERFRRGDRKGSSGLGLAITASVLAAHGGAGEAANGPDGGAVITLRLPGVR